MHKRSGKSKEQKLKDDVVDFFSFCLYHLDVDGYIYYIYLPGDEQHEEPVNHSFAVSVEHPYKRIHLYVGNEVDELTEESRWVLLHEAAHVFLWELHELLHTPYKTESQVSSAEESAADGIAHFIRRHIESKAKRTFKHKKVKQ